MKLTAALGAACLAMVLPPARAGIFFSSTVCSECKCADADPYIIDCSDLQLTSVYSTGDTWPANKSDVRLQYDRNSLTQVALQPALDITDISFRHNDVAAIDDGAFRPLRRLHRLDLSHNSLGRASLREHTFRGQFRADDYQPLPLQVLDLSHNAIHSIFEEAFSHLSSLTELDLSHNPISLLDHHTTLAVTSLPRLRTLRLAGVGLRQLPTGFLHTLVTLRTLDLADNQLTVAPAELYNSHAITSLKLDNNPIKAVTDNSFRGMTKLETLNLSNMPQLGYIGAETFSTLTSLRVLRCRNNRRLWSVSPLVFRGMGTSRGLFPLRELFLNGNNLTSLDEATVPFWDQLLMLQLHDNPWNCDCRLSWMATTLLPHLEVTDPRAADQVLCHSPPALAGVAVVRAADTPDALVCPTEVPPFGQRQTGSGSTLAVALSIGGIVIITGTVLIAYLFWRREKIRRMYSNKLYSTTLLGAVVVLFVSVIFFWFIIAADRSGVLPHSDPLLLRLMGSFFLFLLITGGASFYAIRRQTAAARYRAKQQIRYRRAAMDEEVDADVDPVVTIRS